LCILVPGVPSVSGLIDEGHDPSNVRIKSFPQVFGRHVLINVFMQQLILLLRYCAELFLQRGQVFDVLLQLSFVHLNFFSGDLGCLFYKR